jgi:hypothetical protein
VPLEGDLALAEQVVLYADLPKATARQVIATLEETKALRFSYHKQFRNRRQVTTGYVGRAQRSRTGTAVDNPRLALTDGLGDRTRYGFEIPQSAVFALADQKHDRFTLDWFVMRVTSKTRLSTVKPVPGCIPDKELPWDDQSDNDEPEDYDRGKARKLIYVKRNYDEKRTPTRYEGHDEYETDESNEGKRPSEQDSDSDAKLSESDDTSSDSADSGNGIITNDMVHENVIAAGNLRMAQKEFRKINAEMETAKRVLDEAKAKVPKSKPQPRDADAKRSTWVVNPEAGPQPPSKGRDKELAGYAEGKNVLKKAKSAMLSGFFRKKPDVPSDYIRGTTSEAVDKEQQARDIYIKKLEDDLWLSKQLLVLQKAGDDEIAALTGQSKSGLTIEQKHAMLDAADKREEVAAERGLKKDKKKAKKAKKRQTEDEVDKYKAKKSDDEDKDPDSAGKTKPRANQSTPPNYLNITQVWEARAAAKKERESKRRGGDQPGDWTAVGGEGNNDHERTVLHEVVFEPQNKDYPQDLDSDDLTFVDDEPQTEYTSEEFRISKELLLEHTKGRTQEGLAMAREHIWTVLLSRKVEWEHEHVLMRSLDSTWFDLPPGLSNLDKPGLLSNGIKPTPAETAEARTQVQAAAKTAITVSAWQHPTYDKKQVVVMSKVLKLLHTDSNMTVIKAYAVVTGSGADKVLEPYEFGMLMEVVAQKSEYMETYLGQKKGKQFANAVNVYSSTGCQEMPINLCPCIGWTVGKRAEIAWNAGNLRQPVAMRRCLLYGGCPAALISRFGGKWKSTSGFIGRSNLNKLTSCRRLIVSNARQKEWYDSLSTQTKAEYMCFVYPGTAGTEHFQELKACVNGVDVTMLTPEDVAANKLVFDNLMDTTDHSGDGKYRLISTVLEHMYGVKTERQSDMPRRAPVGGMPVTYTANMINFAFRGGERLVELLHNQSPESDESEVCGTATAIFSLDMRIIREIVCNGWLNVPLKRWWIDLKNAAVQVRRTLMLGDVVGEVLLQLRKIMNVTIRARGDSDITSENFNRGCLVTRKHLWGFDVFEKGISAYTAYERVYQIEARKVVRECFTTYKRDMATRMPADFWEERAIRGATGASKAIKKLDLSHLAFSNSDRPGKKVLVEYLDDDALDRAFNELPTNRAYYFTKPEPGMKIRSLYATYDEETFVCAYANQGVENHMGASKGIMVRQTPADVVEWMSVSEGGLAGSEADGCFWQSTDYSDYNYEHTMWEMCMLDVQCAEAFDETTTTYHNTVKADYFRWCCAGRLHGYIVYGKAKRYEEFTYMTTHDDDTRSSRVLNGLYSGARTTARDNTWIHKIDINIANEHMRTYLDSESMKWVALCGDDEDAAFENEIAAGLYYSTLSAAGHALNPVKQLAGKDNHEFLQLTAARDVRVEKPLNTLLATLATGNWYVQLGTWLQTAITSILSNYWEMYCRGMVKQIARRLAVATLDRLMITRRDDPVAGNEHKMLEWWNYRFTSEAEPLFDIVGEMRVEDMPRFEAVATAEPVWGNYASKAYIRRNEKLLAYLPARIRDEFIENIQGQTIGACYKVWQQKSTKRWCHENWPERTSDASLAVDENESWKLIGRDDLSMVEIRYGMPKKKEMLTDESVAGMMGVPFFLAKRLGGCDKLGGKITPEQWSKYRDTTEQFIPLSGSGHELQMNLRACMSWSSVPHEHYHGDKNQMYPKNLIYVYMGNGAGKTHICKMNRGIEDLDCVWMNAYGSVRAKERDSARKSTFNGLMRTMSELAQIALRRSPMLLGQVEPDTMQQAATAAGIKIKICYFDPGEAVRRARLNTRGWPQDKVEKRLRASKASYTTAINMGATELKTPVDLVRVFHEARAELARGRTMTGWNGKRMPAKYVFDRTEAVTRKLQIDEESYFDRAKIAGRPMIAGL